MIIDLLLHLSLVVVVVVASQLLVIRCRDSLHSLVVLEDACKLLRLGQQQTVEREVNLICLSPSDIDFLENRSTRGTSFVARVRATL